MEEMLDEDHQYTAWVDGFQHQVKIRTNAMNEICTYLEGINITSAPFLLMKNLILRIKNTLENDSAGLNEEDQTFLTFARQNLLHVQKDLLPIPVFSYTRPSMGYQFVLHVLLSMGEFDTEIDLTLHASLREAFVYAKLIGSSTEENNLILYSNEMLHKFVVEQLVNFPNSQRMLDRWICEAGEILDSIIIHNVLPIAEMPPVQLSAIYESQATEVTEMKQKIKFDQIQAARNELVFAIESCSIPTEEELQNACKEQSLQWDALNNFTQFQNQSDDSYKEQKLAVENFKDGVDKYLDAFNNCTFNKGRITHGAPGSGKTFIMQYIVLYAISKGMNVITTAVMARRANQLGGLHIHKLFCLDVTNGMNPHRVAELAVIKLLRNPAKLNLLLTLEMLVIDEAGQVSAEMISTLDIILRKLKDSNLFMAGVLILGTMDHTQLPPIKGRPFLISSHVISCFQMIQLKHSVRANSDPNFQRVQTIARMHPSRYNDTILSEFRTLCSQVFSYATDWQSDLIDPHVIRLYGKRMPGREATNEYLDSIKNKLAADEFLVRIADDTEHAQLSQQEWVNAGDKAKSRLNAKLKEPQELVFFHGALYEFTYNDPNDTFTQSSMCLLFELPAADTISNFQRVKMLAAPVGIKDFQYDPATTLQEYLHAGWREVFVGVGPEKSVCVGNRIKAQRRQYGLRHRFASTVHSSIGYTLMKVGIEVSDKVRSFKLWDKAQVIVVISRTKVGKNTFFVGNKESTLNALCSLVQQKNQWTDYMENVLNVVSLNSESSEQVLFTARSFPYRICDMTLPDCNTGFVYMLVSSKNKDFSYIGETISIRRRLQSHNSGFGSRSTAPSHLRPFAVFALICGFDGNKTLRCHVEYQWKRKRDALRRDGIHCLKRWAMCSEDVLDAVNMENFNMERSQMRLALYFKE